MTALGAAIGLDLGPHCYYDGLSTPGSGNTVKYALTDKPGRDGQWIERLDADEQALAGVALDVWIAGHDRSWTPRHIWIRP